MKKKLALVGFIGFGVLFGCSQVSQDVEAGTEKWFEEVHAEKIDNGYSIRVLKHRESKCYYISTKNMNSGGLVQMMVEKDGVTIPYCEK